MITMLRWTITMVALLLVGISVERAAALGFESFEPAGEHMSRSADWSKGVEEVLRHQARVYWYGVNGSEAAYYDGDIQTVNEILDLYSRVDIAEHVVVIRPGRPSAKSFHGTLTPYVVEFDVPGGVSRHFAEEYASTGLYPLTPRLFVHLDAALAKRLDELKIPANVTLHELATRVEDALPYAESSDSRLRHRAIYALGEAAESSEAVVNALKLAAGDENKSIRTAGETALAKLEAAKDPADQALRQQVADYVKGHPQRARVPSPEELLTALRNADATYEKGFTARGTRVDPAPSQPGILSQWTITMRQERAVFERQDVVDADHPRAEGRCEYTIYVGPDRMASIHGNRLWADGKLIDAKPHVTFEPVGPNYDLLIGRMLWPLGRGFSRRIDRITSVSRGADGLLSVLAENDDGLMSRWELLIDPSADYLVRSAKAFSREETEPSYGVETAGVLTGGGRSVAHTARWIEGHAGLPASISVTSVSATTDVVLIDRTEDRLDRLPSLGR